MPWWRNSKMSFGGQNQNEKANDAAIKQNTAQLGNVATDAGNRSQKAFKFFKQSTKPALDYWSTLLSGDRTALSGLLGPEIGQIGHNFDNAKQNLWNSPRGGGKISSLASLENNEMTQMNNLFTQARPQAASQLAGLGGLFGNLSLGESGQQVNALGGSSQNLFGLNKEQQAVRDQRNQAFGAIGSGVGTAAGGYFGGK